MTQWQITYAITKSLRSGGEKIQIQKQKAVKSSSCEERLHICVGYSCNNNCIFCMEDDREARYRFVKSQTDDDIRRMIYEISGAGEVLFTSGEPTLNRDLLKYIEWAKSAGIRSIGLISNGRVFSIVEYSRAVLRRGANLIIISIHGHDSRTHDALTRTKGSFEQTLEGIRNLSILKEEFNFKLLTSTVVNWRNLSSLKEICLLLVPTLVDQYVFNAMMPDGRGALYFEQLMPRYSDVAAEFRKLALTLSRSTLSKIFIVDVPYCVTEGLPETMRGFVESFYHYEPDGSSGHAKIEASGVSMSQTGALLSGERLFNKITRSHKDSLVKTKGENCALCRYDPFCSGVWEEYVSRFGWEEFQPVKG